VTCADGSVRKLATIRRSIHERARAFLIHQGRSNLSLPDSCADIVEGRSNCRKFRFEL
jgi:hypothetical protein